MLETLYEGPAHDATFSVPMVGAVRFRFSEFRASGYVRSRGGALLRVQQSARLFLSTGQYVLTMYDPGLQALVSITFEPE